MRTFRLDVLGTLRLVDDDGVEVTLRPAQRRVLAALAVSGRHGRSITGITEALWGDKPPATAHNTIQVHVSGIRRAAPASVSTQPGRYSLGGAIVAIDVLDFEAAGESVLGDTPDDWETVRARAEVALDLWRGEPYTEVPEDALAEARRRHLDELRMSLTERRLEAMIALGEEDTALPLLAELTSLHPLRERIWEFLMVCQYRVGRQADALRTYRRVAGILSDQLGIEPGVGLRTLEEDILRQVPSVGRSALATRPTNLLRTATRLVGREEEAQNLAQALDRHRLVTLVGGAGVGKTRLAHEVGWRVLEDYSGGVHVVDLESVGDDDEVAVEIATALRVGEDVSDLNRLARAVKDRPILLILEGVDRAAAQVSSFGAAATNQGGSITILCVGRRPLRVPGEVVLPLGPLDLPGRGAPADEVLASPSTHLLLDGARRASIDFDSTDVSTEAIVDLLERTGGVPLSIELTSRWLASLGPTESSELRELSGGEGVGADIELAMQALAPVDREFLTDVSIVAGRGTLATLRAVGGPDRSRIEVAGSVTRLLDAGLLTGRLGPSGHMSYAIHPPIRDTALQSLTQSRRVRVVVARHAEHFAALAESAPASDLTTIEASMPDYRRALEWLLGQDPRRAATIANRLARHWVALYLTWEGSRWFDRILDAIGDPDLDTLWWSGWVAYNNNDFATATARYEMLARRAAPGSLHEARARYGMARMKVLEDHAAAVRSLEEALHVFRDEASIADITECLMALGVSSAWTGSQERAQKMLSEVLDILGDDGDARLRSICLRYLSLAAYHRDDEAAALDLAEQAVHVARSNGDTRILSGALLQAALVERTWGDIGRAARVIDEALRPIPPTAWFDTVLVLNGALPVLHTAGRIEVARSVAALIDRTYGSQGWQPLHEVNPVYAATRSALAPVPKSAMDLAEVRSQVERELATIG